MPFFIKFTLYSHFYFWLIFLISAHRILCVTVCSVSMDFYSIHWQYFKEAEETAVISCVCLILWESHCFFFGFFGKFEDVYQYAGWYNNTRTRTHGAAYHPMPPHSDNTRHKVLFFFFFFSFFLWPCYPSASLRNTSSTPQSSLGGSTCTSSGCTHVRRTLLNSVNWGDSSTRWLRNRQGWQGTWAAV